MDQVKPETKTGEGRVINKTVTSSPEQGHLAQPSTEPAASVQGSPTPGHQTPTHSPQALSTAGLQDVFDLRADVPMGSDIPMGDANIWMRRKGRVATPKTDNNNAQMRAAVEQCDDAPEMFATGRAINAQPNCSDNESLGLMTAGIDSGLDPGLHLDAESDVYHGMESTVRSLRDIAELGSISMDDTAPPQAETGLRTVAMAQGASSPAQPSVLDSEDMGLEEQAARPVPGEGGSQSQCQCGQELAPAHRFCPRCGIARQGLQAPDKNP